MSNVSNWNVSAAGNDDPPPNGFPEGMAAGQVNDSAREVMAAVARWYFDARGSLVTAGTAGAYTLATNVAPTALSDLPLLAVRFHTANTGAATLNVDSLGAKNLRVQGSTALGANLLNTNVIALVLYNANQDAFDIIGGIPDKSVTNAKLRDSAAVSVIGRSANSSGSPADIAAGADDRVLARVSSALSWVQLTVGMFPNDVVTYAKIQNVSATARVLGRITSGAGDIEELTAANIVSIILAADGAGSGLDADLLDGQHGSFYQNASNLNAGTLSAARLPGVSLRNVTSGQTSGSVTVSTSGPSGGSNGDIWLKREA